MDSLSCEVSSEVTKRSTPAHQRSLSSCFRFSFSSCCAFLRAACTYVELIYVSFESTNLFFHFLFFSFNTFDFEGFRIYRSITKCTNGFLDSSSFAEKVGYIPVWNTSSFLHEHKCEKLPRQTSKFNNLSTSIAINAAFSAVNTTRVRFLAINNAWNAKERKNTFSNSV